MRKRLVSSRSLLHRHSTARDKRAVACCGKDGPAARLSYPACPLSSECRTALGWAIPSARTCGTSSGAEASTERGLMTRKFTAAEQGASLCWRPSAWRWRLRPRCMHSAATSRSRRPRRRSTTQREGSRQRQAQAGARRRGGGGEVRRRSRRLPRLPCPLDRKLHGTRVYLRGPAPEPGRRQSRPARRRSSRADRHGGRLSDGDVRDRPLHRRSALRRRRQRDHRPRECRQLRQHPGGVRPRRMRPRSRPATPARGSRAA